MKDWFVDLHIHIGRTESGMPVKISGAKNLTFYNIMKESSDRKGLDIIGIIDCHSPVVQDEMERLLDVGQLSEVEGGGIRYGSTTVLPGVEIEVRDEGLRPAHLLGYFPDLATIREFSKWLAKHMKNITLSSQRVYVPARQLQDEIVERGGFLIPAHIFTPHKSLYGSCCDRMEVLLDPQKVTAVELGLSSDSSMAGLISELGTFTFVSNSDAHSLGKIGREYNVMRLESPSFAEVRKALLRIEDRAVTANYGLSPRLGKYHRTFCLACNHILDTEQVNEAICPACGSHKITRGVLDRIEEIADLQEPYYPAYRPPYYEQVPLDFIPGLGSKTLGKLIDYFGTEMNILHRVPVDELSRIVPQSIAIAIKQGRDGQLQLQAGGGGIYGKVKL